MHKRAQVWRLTMDEKNRWRMEKITHTNSHKYKCLINEFVFLHHASRKLIKPLIIWKCILRLHTISQMLLCS